MEKHVIEKAATLAGKPFEKNGFTLRATGAGIHRDENSSEYRIELVLSGPRVRSQDIELLDPRADGWRSETLHELAKPALEELVSTLVRRPTNEELASLLADEFVGTTALRPAGLETVFDDGSTTVLRTTDLPRERHEASELPQGHLTASGRRHPVCEAKIRR